MATPRAGASAVALADGRVMVTGGFIKYRGVEDGMLTDFETTQSAVLFDPASGKWEDLAPMRTGRSDHWMGQLVDGRVLVLGGVDAEFSAIGTAEVWDPTTNAWKPLDLPFSPRESPGVQVLPSGQLVIVGGLDRGASGRDTIPLAEVWTFDPASDQFTRHPDLPEGLWNPQLGLLDNGTLVAACSARFDAERPGLDAYERVLFGRPDLGMWSWSTKRLALRPGILSPEDNDIARLRLYGCVVAPQGDRLLVIGGAEPSGLLAKAIVEAYDAVSDRFVEHFPLETPRNGPELAIRPDGSVFLVGGIRSACERGGACTAAAEEGSELLDVSCGCWRQFGSPPKDGGILPRRATLVALPNGDVLRLGGTLDDGRYGLPSDAVSLWRE